MNNNNIIPKLGAFTPPSFIFTPPPPPVSIDATSSATSNPPPTRIKRKWPFPSGVRFCPRDEELLVDYLAKKMKNLPLPCDFVVNDVMLYDYTPHHLAAIYEEMGNKEWYFFTPREKKYRGGDRPNRSISSGDGYWRASGVGKPVRDDKGVVVGFKRNLIFCKGKQDSGHQYRRTNWVMHEYIMDKSDIELMGDSENRNSMRLDWVLCRIYNKDYKKGGDLPCDNNYPHPVSSLPPQQNSMAVSDNGGSSRQEPLQTLNVLDYGGEGIVRIEEKKPNDMMRAKENVTASVTSDIYYLPTGFSSPRPLSSLPTQKTSKGVSDTSGCFWQKPLMQHVSDYGRDKIAIKEEMKDNGQRFGDNVGQLMDTNHASILKSAVAAGQSSGQLHGSSGGMSPQVQARSQKLPRSTPDIKSEMNPIRTPRAGGCEGSLDGIPGLNQGGNNLTLKGWPLTPGLDQSCSLQQQKSCMQGPQPYHQLQMLTPEQQLMLARQNLSSSSANDDDSIGLRMPLNNRNMAMGKDGLTNSAGDMVHNLGSTLLAGGPILSRGDPDMMTKLKFAQLQQQSNNQHQQQLQQHALSGQQPHSSNNSFQQDKMMGIGVATGDGRTSNAFRGNDQKPLTQHVSDYGRDGIATKEEMKDNGVMKAPEKDTVCATSDIPTDESIDWFKEMDQLLGQCNPPGFDDFCAQNNFLFK